jgi:hypothetical protein
MKFDNQAKEYQQAAAAIYERYYDKVDSEG